MENQSNSPATRLVQLSLAILAVLATLLGHVSLAAAESAETTKQKLPLVASPVYFSDATWCYANTWSRPEISSLTANAPCPAGTKAYPSTLWTASVTNPNPRFEARNVRARVILVDANESEIMNKVWTVSTRLAPGATAWVAPAFESICCDYLNVVQATDGRGVAVSGSVTVQITSGRLARKADGKYLKFPPCLPLRLADRSALAVRAAHIAAVSN